MNMALVRGVYACLLRSWQHRESRDAAIRKAHVLMLSAKGLNRTKANTLLEDMVKDIEESLGPFWASGSPPH